MKTLLGLTFSTQYRADLVLDGITNSIEDGTCNSSLVFDIAQFRSAEYQKSAERLGDVEVLDPTPWRTELLRDWYWDFLMEITLDLPTVRHTVLPLLGFTFFSGCICVDTFSEFVSIVHCFHGVSAASQQVYFVEHGTVYYGHAVLPARLFAGQAALRYDQLSEHNAAGYRTLSSYNRRVL